VVVLVNQNRAVEQKNSGAGEGEKAEKSNALHCGLLIS
jgi:hypothetical protein